MLSRSESPDVFFASSQERARDKAMTANATRLHGIGAVPWTHMVEALGPHHRSILSSHAHRSGARRPEVMVVGGDAGITTRVVAAHEEGFAPNQARAG